MRIYSLKRYIIPGIIGILVLTLFMGGCAYPESDDWESPVQPSAEEKTEATAKSSVSRGTVKNEESAILTIYQYLLEKAQTHDAKVYLADFYTICTEWSAESELQMDGTSIWHVMVDVTAVEEWQEKGQPQAERLLREHTRGLMEEATPPADHEELMSQGEAYIADLS